MPFRRLLLGIPPVTPWHDLAILNDENRMSEAKRGARPELRLQCEACCGQGRSHWPNRPGGRSYECKSGCRKRRGLGATFPQTLCGRRVILGVLTLALSTGVTDDKGLMDAVANHWILWTVSSIVTVIGDGGARTLQKYQYVRSVQAGTADTATKIAYVDPSTQVVVGARSG